MADKIDVEHWLEAYHADQCAALLVTPEFHARAKFSVELGRQHSRYSLAFDAALSMIVS